MEEELQVDVIESFDTVSNFILPDGFNYEDLDGAQFVPVNLNEELTTSSSITDLGKQLLKASEEGRVEDIKLLMQKGAPFTADWLGTSPLHFAAQNNHLEVCEILLRAGISKDARTKVDRTPIHMAVYEGHLEIVKCLLDNKADLHCTDMLNMTPLHWAAQMGHLEIVQLLIDHGAQTEVSNKFNLTPSNIANEIQRPDIASLLDEVQTREAEQSPDEKESNQLNAEVDVSNDSTVAYPPVEVSHTEPNSPIPLETVLEEIDSENSIDPESLHITPEELVDRNYFFNTQPEVETPPAEEEIDCKFSESMKILQQHGITMLPADDTNILSSILESGRSVSLTEVGKQVLNSTKPLENTPNGIHKVTKIKTLTVPMKSKKVVKVIPKQYIVAINEDGVLKPVKDQFITDSSMKPITKRIVMKKNKTVPLAFNSNIVKIPKQENLIEIENLKKELTEARKIIEEYKQKYLLKVAEADKYKKLFFLYKKHGMR